MRQFGTIRAIKMKVIISLEKVPLCSRLYMRVSVTVKVQSWTVKHTAHFYSSLNFGRRWKYTPNCMRENTKTHSAHQTEILCRTWYYRTEIY